MNLIFKLAMNPIYKPAKDSQGNGVKCGGVVAQQLITLRETGGAKMQVGGLRR